MSFRFVYLHKCKTVELGNQLDCPWPCPGCDSAAARVVVVLDSCRCGRSGLRSLREAENMREEEEEDEEGGEEI